MYLAPELLNQQKQHDNHALINLTRCQQLFVLRAQSCVLPQSIAELSDLALAITLHHAKQRSVSSSQLSPHLAAA